MTTPRLLAYLTGFTAIVSAQAAFADAPMSATVLEFADPTTLFVADSAGAAIHAYTLLEGEAATESAAYTLEGFSRALAETLAVAEADITFNDLAVHPTTQAAYVSLTAGTTPVVVMVTQDGTITP
ncbi:MAG: hypothetical protein AAFO57_03840, partial [Pseudomonadota bacterium]